LFKRAKKENNEETFNANVEWFDQFKNRVQLHNIKITVEAVSANSNMASKYPDVLKNKRKWWIPCSTDI
jgi:hypothetical protein